MKHTGGSGLTPGLEEALARLEERVRAMEGGALALRFQGGPASRLSDLAGYLEARAALGGPDAALCRRLAAEARAMRGML